MPIKTVDTASKLAMPFMSYYALLCRFSRVLPIKQPEKYRDYVPTWHSTVGGGRHTEM